jgi:membrane fusion protein, multidrug efflux system
MKTTKKLIILFIIIGLVALAVYRLNSNKQKISADSTLASQVIGEVPVKVVSPRAGSINKQIATTGIISASEELTVLSETQGKVIRVNKNVGDHVRKDEAIVEVDDETISANVLVAEANYEQQKKDIERMERLEEGSAIAKHDLEKARIGLKKAEADLITARKALRDTKIKTPISGIVNKRMVENGQFVAGGMPICEIVNISKLKIWIKVPEKDIFKLSKGQIVNITISAIPGKTFSGKINSIGEKADNSMKFDAEVVMDNTEGSGHLKAGLFTEVTIPVEATETLIIEKATIVGSLKSPSVFIVEGNNVVKRAIVTSDADEKYIEVVNGLNKDDKVVVSGQLNLHDGDQVKVMR